MSRSMFATALGAVIASALALTGCGIADALNPSDVLSSDKHVANSAVERNGSSVSEAASTSYPNVPSHSNGFGYNVPDYCGNKSVYLLSSTGEVYQVFLPAAGTKTNSSIPATGINPKGSESNPPTKDYSYCMIPLPYLPAGVDKEQNSKNMYVRTMLEGNVGGYFDALGASNDGSLFAASNSQAGFNSASGHSVTNIRGNTATVYFLSAQDRRDHASFPNRTPNINNYNNKQTTSYWEQPPFATINLGGAYASGGAVDTNGIYWLMAANMSANNHYVDFYKSNSATNPTSMIYAGRLKLSELDGYSFSTLPPADDGDMEFDNHGNLEVYLSWTYDEIYRLTRRIIIPAQQLPQLLSGYSSGGKDHSITIDGNNVDSDLVMQTQDKTTGVPVGGSTGSRTLKYTDSKVYDWQLEGVASDGTETGRYTSLMGTGPFGEAPKCWTNYTYHDCIYNTIPDYTEMGASPVNSHPGQRLYSFTGQLSGNSGTALTDSFNMPWAPPRSMSSGKGDDELVDSDLWGNGSTYWQAPENNIPSRYNFFGGIVSDLARGTTLSTPPRPTTDYYGNLQVEWKVDQSGQPLPGAEFALWNPTNSGCGNSAPTDKSQWLMTATSGTYPAHTGSLGSGQTHDNVTYTSGWAAGVIKFVNIPFSSNAAQNFCYAEVSPPKGYKADSTVYETRVTPNSGKWTDGNWRIDNYGPQRDDTNDVDVGYGRTVGSSEQESSLALPNGGSINGNGIVNTKQSTTGSITIGKYIDGVVSSLSGGTSLKYPYTYEDWWGYEETGYAADDMVKSVESLPTSSTAIRLAGSSWTITSPTSFGTKTYSDCTSDCTTTGTSDSDQRSGVLKFANLPQGKYTITESQAPLGYELNSRSFTITIGPEKAATDSDNGSKMNWNIAFGDKMATGPSLPYSGGLSTLLFQLVALTLLVLASLLAIKLWIKRKGGQRVK